MKFTRSISREISRRVPRSKSPRCPKARRWKLKSWRIFEFTICDIRLTRLNPSGSQIANPKSQMKKSWREKLADDKGLPRVGKVTGKLSKRWGEGVFVIPAPREVDALMRQVPKGRVITINELRAALARKHKADFACPITTGIFSWIAANAAAESEAEGKKRFTPFWRTLKTGGEVNPKYPGGVAALTKRLRAEGHKIIS